MSDIPIVVTTSGAQPTPPATLLAQLLALVAATNPGYTANLPGSLVEDVSSTDVGALSLIDQIRVELINSLTPYGANAFLLKQLGQIYDIQLALATNTSVYVVFSGPVGYVVAQGFTVSDGTYQYIVQDGGIIGSDSTSAPLFCLATQTGSWAVPAGTVTQLVTSVPSVIALTVTNPQAGTPGNSSETEASYRSRVLQAGYAPAQGMTSYLKTILGNVIGVEQRLISALQQVGGGWEIIVGGNGDPYQIANAIFTALFDISTLVGSTMAISGITRANPGVVTTTLNYGLSTGTVATIASVDPTNYNGSYSIVPITEKTFSLGTAYAANNITALSWASTSGGQVTASTATDHGVTVGSSFTISGCSPSGYNGTFTALAGTGTDVLIYALASNPGTATAFGTLNAGIANVDTTSYPAYVSGGVVTPNPRNQSITIQDYPDTYVIPFVVPPQQTVTMTVTWNTTASNYVSASAVAQLGAPALVAYVNALPVGVPMNLFELQATFQMAIAGILPPQLLTRMVFSVSINGVGVSPESGTGIIAGDPESYFYAVMSGIVISQG